MYMEYVNVFCTHFNAIYATAQREIATDFLQRHRQPCRREAIKSLACAGALFALVCYPDNVNSINICNRVRLRLFAVACLLPLDLIFSLRESIC